MGYRDNHSQVDAELARLQREMRPQRGAISNVMEYAEPLHKKHGYWVLSDTVLLQNVRDAIEKAGKVLPLTGTVVEMAVEFGIRETINFYRSETSEMRPPVKAGEGFRKAHPGSWADISGSLAGAYEPEVNGKKIDIEPYSKGGD